MVKQNNYTLPVNPMGIFFLVLSVLLVVVFLLLAPHFAFSINQNKHNLLLQNFIDESAKNNHIDPQAFWQVREFYSIGSFSFKPEGFLRTDIQSFLTQMDTPLFASQSGEVFLVYNSPKVKSIDSFVLINNPLESMYDSLNGDLLLNTPKERIIRNNRQVLILFVKPLSEMKQANGFLDYLHKNDNFMKKHAWLNITSIEL